MKLTEVLAPQVPVVLRDYIHAAIEEALAPVYKELSLRQAASEAALAKASQVRAEVADRAASFLNEAAAANAEIAKMKKAGGKP